MDDYLELNLKIEPFEPWNDVLAQDLSSIGFDSFSEEDGLLKAYIKSKDFDQSNLDKLLEAYPGVNISSHFESIPSVNWNKEWEANFDPVEVGGRIYIRAPFHDASPDLDIEILLTPKMSFGTGHHATTFMMMEEMLDLDLENSSVLDVGCGTSILSVLAEMLGAKDLLAIDNDDWAVENSKENIVINNSTRIIVEKAEISSVNKKSFNVILANINRNVIVNDLKKYAELLENKGHILLSGFRGDDIQMIRDLAKKIGLVYLNERVRDEWRMLHFVKEA